MSEKIIQLINILNELKKHKIQALPLSNENIKFLKNINGNKLYQGEKNINKTLSGLINSDENKNNEKDGDLNFDKNYSDKKIKWENLKTKVLSNSDLLSHVKPGKNLVFGVGNLNAKIFFCGEAPGADEEIKGIPFIGRAGQLLTKIISAMGFSRDDVYIGNIMNWRPEMDTITGNRPPTQEEMQFCLPYLIEQIKIVQPSAIVALGATAANGLLGYDKKRKMSDIRGQWFKFAEVPLMITFHPSYLLRNNSNKMKRIVWEDMLCVMKYIGLQISEKQQKYFLDS